MNETWADSSVFYHIYPLGCCGAERENDMKSEPRNRIGALREWVPHMLRLGVNAVYFGPVFESLRHGYDTADYAKIDRRLGTNADFSGLCDTLHAAGMRIILDGVFHHAGRDFWAFQDVKRNGAASPYKDWFFIRFDGDSHFHDGFCYEGWEGYYELVKLNLGNNGLKQYLFECVKGWMEDYHIDGLRLDVAYCIDKVFLSELASFCRLRNKEFWLLGEMIHGDYTTLARPGLLQSATNYECYKGLFSSFNSKNMFEIAHSLERQWGGHDWSLYNDLHLYNFADNHDVPRLASQLEEPRYLPLLYAMLFGMPGIPSLYYGSEWGMKGKKGSGADADNEIRPAVSPQELQWTALTARIAALSRARRESRALWNGTYAKVFLTNEQFVFERSCPSGRVLVCINLSSDAYQAHFSGYTSGTNLISGQQVDLSSGYAMQPCSAEYIAV